MAAWSRVVQEAVGSSVNLDVCLGFTAAGLASGLAVDGEKKTDSE
jgi:hypothetical protein